MADSTWKTYKTAVESFQSFRKLYNLQDTWPAPLYDLLFYIAYMSHTGLSASTQGRIQDFKLGGGAHLKKLCRAEGGAKIFGVFRVKNHDFTPQNNIFPILGGGGRAKFLGYFM